MILSVKLDFELSHLELASCDDEYNFSGLELFTKSEKSIVAEKYGSKISELLDLLSCEVVNKKVMCVTMRQARLALLNNGMLDKVDELLTDQTDKITWEYATEVYRNSQLVSKLKESLSLTDEVLDNLFIEAEKL